MAEPIGMKPEIDSNREEKRDGVEDDVEPTRSVAIDSETSLDSEPSRETPASLRMLASLACDWAFVLRGQSEGWRLEWSGGAAQPDGGALCEPAEDAAALIRFVAEDDRPVATAHFARALDRGRDRAEYRLTLPGSGARWFESTLRTVASAAGPEPERLYGVLSDVTARRETQAALQDSESRYRALVEQASDGVLVCDPEGRIRSCNAAALQLFARSRASLLGCRLAELFHAEDVDRDPLVLRNLASGMTLRTVRRLACERSDGGVWAELSARRLDDGRVQLTARDITARIEAEQRIQRLAYFDSLTSLPNRELFREQLESALDRARRTGKVLSLLFLDIDRFKQVNDSLGHSMGDDLLALLADRLRSAVRVSDSVGRAGRERPEGDARGLPISRLGGDEFTVLLQDLDHAQDAARVARRVLHLLSRPCQVQGREIFIGASVGIAVWPEDGQDAESLLRSADVAMHHAKSRGGNAYEFFSPDMNAASTRRLDLETGLRHAIERDELRVHYQPIRDTRTGRVSAVEALVRWQTEDGKLVRPDEFIPIAEETGLIVPIGEWVLRRACEQAVAWRDAGIADLRVSVNLSVEQLHDLGIANAVEQILFDTGLSAAQLELEITESSILDSSPNIVAGIGALSTLGIGFALDDFGTGYSSLSALQRFPIDRVKIDRSFVSGIGDCESDEALASAVIALARRLDLSVVAEGVETEGQAGVLTELGCHELQGYLFSKPLPAEECGRLLARCAKGQDAAEDD